MVYRSTIFVLHLKRNEQYKQYQENYILSVLKTLQCTLIHVTIL